MSMTANLGSELWSALQWIAFGLIFVLFVASSAAQETSTTVPRGLTFVGEVSKKANPPPGMYLWNDGKVFVSSYRGAMRWTAGPSIQLIDARDGKELQKREIKVPCSGDYTFSGWQAIPNSTDVLVEGGCGHLLLLDGTTLETKRELTTKVPPGEKLWNSHAIVSPDSKRVALEVVYETRKASRAVLSILRTSDWQEEGSWQTGSVEDGRWHSTFSTTPLLFTIDGQRLLGGSGRGLRVLRLPSGEHESDIDIDTQRGEMDDLIAHVVPTNPDEIVLIDKKSGTVWAIHLKDRVRDRRAQFEDWPQLQDYYSLGYGVSPDGNWLCAPTFDPVRENVPAFALWSTTTGKVLARSEALTFSPEEKGSAARSTFGHMYSQCKAAPDGKYVLLQLEFGKLARSRIYQLVFEAAMAVTSNARQQTGEAPRGQESLQQPKPMVFSQADRQRLINTARHLKPGDVPALEQKAESGDVEAQIVMGVAYGDGNAVPKDYGKAFRLFHKAAASGHPMGESSLGFMYVIGQGTQRNPAEAFKWFQKAAEQGDAQGEANLGWMYYTGESVERDPAKAVEWFRKAADGGSSSGMNRLGIAYEEGQGVPRDSAQAVNWYLKAAETGDLQSQYNLAQKYDQGLGVLKDHAEAARWYRRAADQDYVPAQFDMAMAYHEGEGVPKDNQEAAKWFEKASNLGLASATYYLARMYLDGSLGHDVDAHRVSLEKFQKAAEQGYPLAAMNLGEIHASWLMTGFLTDSGRDYKQACRWLYIAQELQQRHQWDRVRPSDAKLLEHNLPGRIRKIEKSLSSDDLATCQREAAEWARVHPTTPPQN